MFREIENKIKAARKAFKSIGYVVGELSTQEFSDFMTGEIFSEDATAFKRCPRERISHDS